jgi:hypothetical protein
MKSWSGPRCPHLQRLAHQAGLSNINASVIDASGSSLGARVNALESRTSQGADADAARVRALAAYKDFLTLWKDADPDIPILTEAKAEYAKLQ